MVWRDQFLAVVLGMGLSSSGLATDIAVPPTLFQTKPLDVTVPLDEVMVSGINRFALRDLEASVERRHIRWHCDYSNPQAYAASVEPNRRLFETIVGAVDTRVVGPGIELIATARRSSVVMESASYVVHAVRWRVLDGVTAEGLLLQPNQPPVARVVAVPDADWTPEMFAGLAEGVAQPAQLPRRLAENGIQVLVPVLINRDDTYSGNPEIRYSNQTHREFIYRMAFEMGRHIIGYEVQKIRAAADQFTRRNTEEEQDLPIGVVGVGEGGLLAFYAAALDRRIDSVLVCGYFQQREGVWQEPIYRNVWSLLTAFGDAEIAGLIAPRSLVIEACAVPEVAGPPPARKGRPDFAAPGRIGTARLVSVRAEFQRAQTSFDKLNAAEKLTLAVSDGGTGPAGSETAFTAFLRSLHRKEIRKPSQAGELQSHNLPDAEARQHRQFNELVVFTQTLMRHSARVRDQFWSKADRSSAEAWANSVKSYRDYVWEEMIGKLPKPTMPINPRSRLVLNDDDYVGYEVMLDVYPDVIAAGILLLPADLKDGERRPVVVCQHGLEGTPLSTITTEGRAYHAYQSFSTELVKRGFIVYAPQNPYKGYHEFRSIQRKSNPMKRSLFSYIIRQHERTLEWLSSLPFVDARRIGFYGLSYGGKTAVRVPTILKQYALSICSGDFNEWILKNVSSEDRYSYVFTREYEMFEWNMGHVANYAELASLMVPRPFMVERGHRDGVAPDEWVAWEYAKVRRLYDELGIGDQTTIEFFNGPHMINGQETYQFLHQHLDWPVPAAGR